MKSNSTTCGLIFLALIAAAACVTGSVPTTVTANSQLSAACQQAEDDCKAQFDAVAAEGAALTTTCQGVGSACQAGPSSACTQAQDDCTNGMTQLENDSASATASCNSEVSMNCDPTMTGSGSGSGSGSGLGSGLSSACEMAVNDCLQQTQMLLQGNSLPDCGSSLVSACMDPTNISGCQTAVMACENDAQNLQTMTGSIASQCSQEIMSACQ